MKGDDRNRTGVCDLSASYTYVSRSTRYPLYDRSGNVVATIDEAARVRNRKGRFVNVPIEERRALLAACRIVAEAAP